MKNPLILALLSTSVAFTACVTSKQYKETEAKKNQCETELTRSKKEADSLTILAQDRRANIEKLEKEKIQLVTDSAITGQNVRQMKVRLSTLSDEHDLLLERHKLLESGTAADQKKLSELFQKSQSALIEQEEMLKRMSSELDKQETNLQKAKIELKEREKRTSELEAIIFRKDSAVQALKRNIANALLGFKNNGLTVEQRNGKVYVSVEEKLLFQSGSWAVDPKGQDALKKLAKVLESQEDISIMVEGHTDNVPFIGSNQVKDNWDLSVMRATAITKLLLASSKLKPSQIASAGRSEFCPIEKGSSAEARQKNRRTEIIITPKVDELLKILETN